MFIDVERTKMSEWQYLVWRAAACRMIKDGVSFKPKGNGFVSLFTEWED